MIQTEAFHRAISQKLSFDMLSLVILDTNVRNLDALYLDVFQK